VRDSDAPISIIVPCLNAEKTLPAALESVLNQTAPPIEILVIDDASTDRSAAVAAAFDPRVRVLSNPGRGPGAARCLGVQEARGEFIAFVDADDLIEPTKHEKQLAVLENSDPYTLVHTGSLATWTDGSRPDYQRVGAEQAVGQCLPTIFERNPVCGASTMLRRSVILELGNYDPDLFGTEDLGMSLSASTRCEFVYLPEPLYVMIQHATNITRRRAHMAYFHWLAQERFRQNYPTFFEQLPDELVQHYMIDPVLRTVRDAYWQRNSADYSRLLHLAHQLAANDPTLQPMWQRRHIPMRVLRAWDRLRDTIRQPATETP